MQDKVKLLVKDCVKVNNVLYCIAKQFNLIFSLDTNTDKVKILSTIPDNVYECMENLGCITFYNDELYIGQIMSNDIWIFNITTKKWDNIVRKEVPNTSAASLLQSFVYNGRVYMMGGSYPAIIIINPNTKEIEYIEKPFKDKSEKNIIDAYFRAEHVLIGDLLYIPCCFDNTILIINLITEEYKWVNIGESSNRYSGITYDGKYFWLSPRHNSNIVKWDGSQNVHEIKLPNEYDNSIYFGGCCRCGDRMYIWNVGNGETIYILLDENKVLKNENKYIFIKEMEGLTVFQNRYGWFDIYKDGLYSSTVELQINYSKIKGFYENNNLMVKRKEKMCDEGEPFSIGAFLEMI